LETVQRITADLQASAGGHGLIDPAGDPLSGVDVDHRSDVGRRIQGIADAERRDLRPEEVDELLEPRRFDVDTLYGDAALT